MTRLRLIEIGVALLLTFAALVVIGLTVWAAEAGKISVADAWARPTIGQGRVTAVYLTIVNNGEQEDVLNSASAAKAKSVELHQTTMTAAGVMQMREVEGGLPIAAGGKVALEPGGMHLMVLGLDEALAAGDQLVLTLDFAKAGPVEVAVPVSANTPPDSGAEHKHH